MPKVKRIKTKYTGVYYVEGRSQTRIGKMERIYYIRYRKNGKEVEKKAGRQYADKMTLEKAAEIRAELIKEGQPSSKKLREKPTIASEDKLRPEMLEQEMASRKMIEEKWVLFMKSATDGFTLFDKDLNLVELNDMTLELFLPGKTKEGVMGRNLFEISPESKRQGVYERCMEVIRDGKPLVIEDVVAPIRFGEDLHFNVKAFKVGDGLGIIMTDITKRHQIERELKERETELVAKTGALEDLNTALTVLLKKREQDKSELEDKVLFSAKELVIPYLEGLRNTDLNIRQWTLLDIALSNLGDIVSPFAEHMSTKISSLTPTELKVANLVKQGKTTKEIAELLYLSPKTIDCHRENIRKKIGIKNTKINLRTHLISNT